MSDRSRVVGLVALTYVVVSLATILVSVALAPWFDWTTNALSDLGAARRATRPVFNGGLILGGVLGVVVGAWLARTHRGVARLGGLTFVVTMGLRTGIGLFPVGTPLHTPIAVSYFVGVAVSLWLLAVGAWRSNSLVGNRFSDESLTAGDVIDARLTALAGTLVPVVRLSWGVWWDAVVPGLAVPEILSSLGLLAWLIVLGRRLRE